VYNKEIQSLGLPDAIVIAFLTSLGVGFAVIHAIYRFTTLFQLFFGTLASLCAIRLCIHYTHVTDARAKDVARSYVRNSLMGFALWMVDYHLCQYVSQWPVNPQGHAWWHIFMGISSYHGPVFMQYVRCEQLQQKPRVLDSGFGVDTISIQIHDDKTKKKSI
jgi:dihydroceramidase